MFYPSQSDMIRSAFAALRWEYPRRSVENNPPKASITLDTFDGGLPSVFLNSMVSVLTDGFYGTKIIRVDEPAGRMSGQVAIFDPAGDLVGTLPASDVTPIRCGLMAALAADTFFAGRVSNRPVGFIGAGRINTATAGVFSTLFGHKEFLVKNSHVNPHKQLDLASFKSLGSYSQRSVYAHEELSDCEIIVSCTSQRPEYPLAHHREFKVRDNHSRLFVAQDMGWLLAPDFRALVPCFTDDLVQTMANFDAEFPNDTSHTDMLDFTSAGFSHFSYREAVAYLYGIAMADVVVAREMLIPDFSYLKRSLIGEGCRV